jgi:hypothetical protein
MRLAVICFLLFALPANTGQTSQTHERISLDVGAATVWLGMPQEEAAKKFRDAGYKVMVAHDQLLLRSDSDARAIWFKDGRLVFADREWNTNNTFDKVDAVIGALGELAERVKTESCVVVHSPISSPESTGNRVFVSCGERSVLIAKGTLMGTPYETVSERIGNIPAESEK